MSNELCDIIRRKTNRKGRKVIEDYNNKLVQKYKAFKRPPPKVMQEHISEMWKPESLPLFRAAMSRDLFKMFLRYVRFNNQITCDERAETDKVAPIRDLAKQLCMPAIETRSAISEVIRNPSTRISMKMVLGRQIIQPVVTIPRDQPSHDASGRIPVVGSCTICRQLNQRHRKTRKRCHVYTKPVTEATVSVGAVVTAEVALNKN
ncbi:hypothetical protein ILUMI_00859 [Ignelater luminosus]|uniref:Uncharacterized protein n=1 Tax=Ignelater luminosus TaxID=2038154 RepID=A0A8K0DRU1_IGNLU|nr:hypothetical protein ILUMI_00859 [Ignelater luminosus]